ncbi:DUF6531 domain-containing protein [Pseudothauera nasutitermitis]|nr:RHS repeat-associated core domain-containing protein [Pseudothauera nasutitermitis]
MSTAPLDCGAGDGGATECASEGPASPGNTSGTELGAGNPINVVSGNKYQRETDLPALPGPLGLEIVRHYNSSFRGLGQMGYGWRLSYETDLYVIGNTVQILTADGRRLIFERDPADPSLCAGANPADGRIAIRRSADGREHYRWIWPGGRELDFNPDGRLVSIAEPNGPLLILTRGPRGELLQVSDPQGRTLVMHYGHPRGDGFRGIVAIDSPVGRFDYTHESSGPGISNLLRVQYPDGRGGRYYHYEPAHRAGHPHALTGISQDMPEGDGLLRLATWAYDEQGRAILSVRGEPKRLDEAGRPVPGTGIEQVELAFVKPSLPDGRPGETLLTNSLGQQTRYRHAQIGGQYRLLEARGPGCAGCGETDVRYGYDRRGSLTEKTKLDRTGQPLWSLLWEYDPLGRVVRHTRQDWQAGQVTATRLLERREYEAQRHAPGLIARPSVVPGKEHQLRIDYNERGQPLRVRETGYSPLTADGEVAATPEQAARIERTTIYTYRSILGRSLLAEIDGPLPNGPGNSPEDSDITRYEWDARGNFITAVTHPMGLVERFEYQLDGANPTGLLAARTDVTRVRAELSMRFDGQPSRILRGPREVLIDYDAEGRPIHYRANDGRSAHIEYRGDGTVRYTLPDGQRIEERFDTESRLNAVSWLDNGQIASPAAPRTPSAAAPLKTRFDPQAQRIEFDLAGARFGVGFEPDGHALTLPTGANHRERFDDFGRVVLQEGPERGRRIALYDAADRTLEVRDAERSMQARYDAAGRLVERRHRVHGQDHERVVRHVWEGAHRVRIEDEEQFSHFDYDAQGRLRAESIEYPARDGLPAQSHLTRYHYDALDRPNRTELPEGAALVYRYDGIGRVSRIDYQPPAHGWWQRLLRRIWPERGMQSLLADVQTDSRNGLVAYTHANGQATRLERNAEGRLLARHDGPVSTRLGYDASGRIATLTRAGQRLTLEHDPLGRLRAVGGAFEQGFVLDANGNRLNLRQGDTDTAYTYRPASDQLLARGAQRYTYNAVGEPLRIEDTGTGSVRTLEYDALGQIARIEQDGRTLARYRYNHERLRIAREVDGHITRYLWQGGQLAAEADAHGRIRVRTFYQGSRAFAQVRYDERGQASLYAIHTDHLGAALAVSDTHGRTVWQADYDVYGRASVHTHSLHSAAGPPARSASWIGTAHASATPDFDFTLRLPGQFEDPETGWHYNVHRYYDPHSGRYLTPDPLGLDGGPNLYAYALSAPLSHIDPLGLEPDPDDRVSRPWLFGTAVHSLFSAYVLQLEMSSGSAGGIFGTGPGGGLLKADAYIENGRFGYIWELKPSTYQTGHLYAASLAQLDTYVINANLNSLIKWEPGDCSAIAPNDAKLKIGAIPFDGYFYEISIHGDPSNTSSGLIFYDFVRLGRAPADATREVYSLTEEENWSITDMRYWEEITGLTGTALILYLIFSEGSRLFPPRNLVPVP